MDTQIFLHSGITIQSQKGMTYSHITQMNLENMMPNERNQTEKATY
jgi:hypothetical protein